MPGSSSLIGSLAVNLSLETAAFQNAATNAQRRMAAMSKGFASAGESISKVGTLVSVGLTAPFAALLSKAIPAARESREAMGQVNAALASMGDASGKSVGQLQKAAEQLQHLSTFDDDDILRKVTANLLTFGNVAGTEFDRAQKAAVDMATRLNMDLQPATVLIGKALNDPIKGMGALSKAGIQFTADQKQMIQGMVDTGNAAGAQRIILGELEKQFGGSAKAARDATPGADTIDAWRQFQETVGEMALKVLPPLTDFLTRALTLFNGLSPATQAWVVGIAATSAALGPVLLVLGPMVTAVGSLLPLLTKLGPVLGIVGRALLLIGANPVILGIAAVVAGIYVAWQNWDKIEPIVSKMVSGVTAWLGKLATPFNWVRDRLTAVGKAFFELYDKVVGHSYVPDLIEEVGDWFSRLQTVMVDPALSATQKASAAFEGLAGVIGKLFGAKAGNLFGSLGKLFGTVAPLLGGAKAPTQGFTGPPMANGGSGIFGGRPGVDRNVLSLNGSPIARVSRGEHFAVTPSNRAGQQVTVLVQANDYFDAKVADTAGKVAAPMAGRAAMAGAAGAFDGMGRQQRRQIP